jgi:tRNA(Ile2) C34 agmatinyltransferase TiaS
MSKTDKQLSRAQTNVAKHYLVETFALIDADAPFAETERPDEVGRTAWRKLKRVGVVAEVGTESTPYNHHESDRRNVYRVPGHVARLVLLNWEDPRDDTLCPDHTCNGTGFSNTPHGYRCPECGRWLSRERIEDYYGGGS